MNTRNALIAVALSAVISSVCTATIIMATGTAASRNSTPSEAGDLNLIDSQLTQIKAELALETQARISLAQQLNMRHSETVVSSSSEIKTPAAVINAGQTLDQDSQAQSRQLRAEQRRADRLVSQQSDYRQQRLIDSGFAQEEAARIIQIESEESLRRLQAQYDRRREYAASTGGRLSDLNPIRAELGDQNYQRYLEANGWPTSASIGSVIGGSPGESAGLRAGDNVVSYAGERVFNLNEINNLTIQGQVGESVLIEVERNGESVQLTIPRGPIGINSGRRYRR